MRVPYSSTAGFASFQTRVLVVVAALLALSPLCYSSDLGVLKGVITRPGGAGVSGVLVQVEHWGIDKRTNRIFIDFEKTVYTDGEGKYSMDLPAGGYDVFVSSPALSPIAMKFDIKPHKQIIFSPEMKYDPLSVSIE